MKKILILFAHPRYEKSRANRSLLAAVSNNDSVTIHDLYEQYPDFNIDIAYEKTLLLSHDIIIWQYPLYMYSPPAMIKQWIDLVLEHGWAHGAESCKLENKLIFNAISTGGTRESYVSSGFNQHTIKELLVPLEQTACLCKMIWLPPFMVQGTYRLTEEMFAEYANRYRHVLLHLSQKQFRPEMCCGYEFLNDWIRDVASLQEKP